MESLREDADDGGGFSVEDERAADHGGRAAEFLMPVAVREKDGLRTAGQIVFARKKPAEGGLNSEEWQGAVGDVETMHLLRFARAGDGQGIVRVGADVSESGVLFAVNEINRGRHIELAET